MAKLVLSGAVKICLLVDEEVFSFITSAFRPRGKILIVGNYRSRNSTMVYETTHHCRKKPLGHARPLPAHLNLPDYINITLHSGNEETNNSTMN